MHADEPTPESTRDGAPEATTRRAHVGRPPRHLVLPARGTLLVNTDLHGNGDDFRALREVFRAALARDPDAHWVLLGDLVHAPDEASRREEPALYDYPDESLAIVTGVLALQREHPGRVHFVLGNHDYGHLGGPHTRKFHSDEVAHLEAALDDDGRAALRELFSRALLAVAAPCGALLAHGSPDERLTDLRALDEIDLPPDALGADHRALLSTLLTSYGQASHVTARMLASVSRGAGCALSFVVHGHDRDEAGWFIEGDNQLCPVIFGAPRVAKRFVLLDLAARYDGVHALRDEHEIRRLYPAG